MKISNLKFKIVQSFIIIVFLLLSNAFLVFAESPYVLPYPSAMPGSVFYKLNLIQEEILKYWYFGDFGQFKYNLSQSDKYLVESKTLFDYKQYLLAYQALQKSDKYFQKIKPAILFAKRNKKSTSLKDKILKEAAKKHIEELENLKTISPAIFEWTPEKQNPQTLKLSETLQNSMKIRRQGL